MVQRRTVLGKRGRSSVNSLKKMISTWKEDGLLRRVVKNSGYLFSSSTLSIPLGAIQSILAARLLGASYARFEAFGTKQAAVDQSELDDFETATRNQLGEKEFLEAWQAGQILTLQESVSLALTELDLGE